MKMIESRLAFDFADAFTVTKFDDTDFYRTEFQGLPNAKGVDFVADSKELLLFVEVKNFKGYENDNLYRIAPNNRKIHTAPATVDDADRESLDIEVSKKIAMTLACLAGAHTQYEHQKAAELKPYSLGLFAPSIAEGRKGIKVLLFLEGDFGSKTRNKKMIMRDLKMEIKKKLAWLRCDVFVEDVDSQKGKWFRAAQV